MSNITTQSLIEQGNLSQEDWDTAQAANDVAGADLEAGQHYRSLARTPTPFESHIKKPKRERAAEQRSSSTRRSPSDISDVSRRCLPRGSAAASHSTTRLEREKSASRHLPSRVDLLLHTPENRKTEIAPPGGRGSWHMGCLNEPTL
jgi:hypothetical protein